MYFYLNHLLTKPDHDQIVSHASGGFIVLRQQMFKWVLSVLLSYLARPGPKQPSHTFTADSFLGRARLGTNSFLRNVAFN